MTTKISTPKKPRSRRKPARIWHLVTNHQNMLYMLAAGMVMSPAGFRDKYYADPLSIDPGWIPLFRDKVKIPADVLQRATSERKHLLPCIASFDLRDLSVPACILSRDGRRRDIELDSAASAPRKLKNDLALLVPTPLPLILLSSINFCSTEHRQAFERAANDVSNVDLTSLRLEISEPLFATDTQTAWPTEPPQTLLLDDSHDTYPAFGQARGGVLAMLYHAANRSALGIATFKVVTDTACDKNNARVQSDPILAELSNWMEGGAISAQADTRTRLFWGLIQSLITAQAQKRPQTPIDVVLGYLEYQFDQLNQLQEMEFQPHLEQLIADMRDSCGLGGGTITELFKRYKGPLSRSLLLFCLREHCTDLLEFSHPLLNDADYLLAAILFGVRDSWLQLPGELRDPAMSAIVALRMADAEHRKQGNKLTIAAEPPRPEPLRELFTSPDAEWSSGKQSVALEFASICNWHDCIQTHVRLAETDLDLPNHFERKGLHLVLPGRVKTVMETVDKNKFLHRLGQWPPVDPQLESELREKLANMKDLEAKVNA